MALCRCPECGKEGVSETARSCPNCGFNIRTYQRKQRHKSIGHNIWNKFLDFGGTRLGKVWGITFLIGILFVCGAAYGIDEEEQLMLLFLPAVYYGVAYLGIGLFMRWFFDDATGVATVVVSPMCVSAALLYVAINLGWVSYPLLAWGIHGGMVISIMILEYKVIKELE